MKRLRVTPELIQELTKKEIDRITKECAEGKTVKDLTIDISTFPKAQQPNVTLLFKECALKKLRELVNQSKDEIAWHGLITREITQHEDGSPADVLYTYEDCIVFPQMVNAATVDTDEALYGNWFIKNTPRGHAMYAHGHSHVNMGVTPSGTDNTYRENKIRNMDKGFYLFTIHNKADAVDIKLYDFDLNFVIESATDIKIVKEQSEFTAWAAEQIKENVKQITFTAPVQQNVQDYIAGQGQARQGYTGQRLAITPAGTGGGNVQPILLRLVAGEDWGKRYTTMKIKKEFVKTIMLELRRAYNAKKLDVMKIEIRYNTYGENTKTKTVERYLFLSGLVTPEMVQNYMEAEEAYVLAGGYKKGNKSENAKELMREAKREIDRIEKYLVDWALKEMYRVIETLPEFIAENSVETATASIIKDIICMPAHKREEIKNV